MLNCDQTQGAAIRPGKHVRSRGDRLAGASENSCPILAAPRRSGTGPTVTGEAAVIHSIQVVQINFCFKLTAPLNHGRAQKTLMGCHGLEFIYISYRKFTGSMRRAGVVVLLP